MGRGTNAKPITLRSLNIYVHIIKFYYFYLNEEAPEVQLIYICASTKRFLPSSSHFRLAGEPQSGLVTSQHVAAVHQEQLGTINSPKPLENLASSQKGSGRLNFCKNCRFMKYLVVICSDYTFVCIPLRRKAKKQQTQPSSCFSSRPTKI